MNNFPTASRPDSLQRYDVSASAHTLLANCAALGLVFTDSLIPGAGKAVRTERPFKSGARVGWMWGKFVEQSTWDQLRTRRVDPTHKPGEEDFAAPVSAGIWRCVAVPQQRDGSHLLIGSEQCPLSYINHTDDDNSVNVSLVADSLGALDPADQTESYRYFPILATRDIGSGEELLAHYQWGEKDWRDAKKRMKLAAAAVPSPSLQPRCRVLPLLAGSPPYAAALKQQEENMHSFLASNAEAFSKMRYEPWTVDTKLSDAVPLPTVVRSSRMVPSIMGVYLESAIVTSKLTFVAPYPGLLMTSSLLESFNKLYHCPTAVRVPQLDYEEQHDGVTTSVRMELVGLPTSPGVIINDGAPSKFPSQQTTRPRISPACSQGKAVVHRCSLHSFSCGRHQTTAPS